MPARQRKGNDNTTSKTLSTSVVDEKKVKTSLGEADASSAESRTGTQPIWIVLAVASGVCAAVNGVLAKLTTTSLTTNLARQLSMLLNLPSSNTTTTLFLRGTFLSLNLIFNGVMWGLFTAALTKGSSSTQVSIVNVSSNFLVTALLGWAVFGETLSLGWWVGAAFLVAGNVVIGRRESGEQAEKRT